jgi:hypothetical protein
MSDCQHERTTRLDIDVLIAALDRLERDATKHANETGCPGSLGAALSDARSILRRLGRR